MKQNTKISVTFFLFSITFITRRYIYSPVDLCRENCDQLLSFAITAYFRFCLLFYTFRAWHLTQIHEYHFGLEYLIGHNFSYETQITMKNTRINIFPFDLHKYDYALIVLVIWFHDFTLVQQRMLFTLRFSFLSS